jgi:hypothetical protein
MTKLILPALICACLVIVVMAADEPKMPAKDKSLSDEGLTPIFDGKTLKGWHASAKTGHSRASNNKSGGRWVVEDGTIVGSQDIPGNAG